MITLILAWINAKYAMDYMVLFVGTIVLDLALFALLESIAKALG